MPLPVLPVNAALDQKWSIQSPNPNTKQLWASLPQTELIVWPQPIRYIFFSLLFTLYPLEVSCLLLCLAVLQKEIVHFTVLNKVYFYQLNCLL